MAITGFAKFAKVERAARMGRNPATGEAIKIKASKKARITPLKGFKDAVMTPSQAPKLNKGVFPARLTPQPARTGPGSYDPGPRRAQPAAAIGWSRSSISSRRSRNRGSRWMRGPRSAPNGTVDLLGHPPGPRRQHVDPLRQVDRLGRRRG